MTHPDTGRRLSKTSINVRLTDSINVTCLTCDCNRRCEDDSSADFGLKVHGFPVDPRLPGYCPDGQAPALLQASHLAICFGVGFLGTEVAFLRILAAPLSWLPSIASALSLSSDARTLTQRPPRPLRSSGACEGYPFTPRRMFGRGGASWLGMS